VSVCTCINHANYAFQHVVRTNSSTTHCLASQMLATVWQARCWPNCVCVKLKNRKVDFRRPHVNNMWVQVPCHKPTGRPVASDHMAQMQKARAHELMQLCMYLNPGVHDLAARRESVPSSAGAVAWSDCTALSSAGTCLTHALNPQCPQTPDQTQLSKLPPNIVDACTPGDASVSAAAAQVCSNPVSSCPIGAAASRCKLPGLGRQCSRWVCLHQPPAAS